MKNLNIEMLHKGKHIDPDEKILILDLGSEYESSLGLNQKKTSGLETDSALES